MWDWDAAKVVLDLVQWGVTGAVALYVWIAGRHQATVDHIQNVRNELETAMTASVTDLSHRLTNHADRLTRTEGRLEGMPEATSIHELAMSIERYAGEMHVIGERLDGLREIVRRLEVVTERQEDHLLRGARP